MKNEHTTMIILCMYLYTVGEDGEYEVICSTQCLELSQSLISRVLGVASNKITCKAKRLGGGFGGKETKAGPLSAAVAVAANKLNRPVRMVLERDDDIKLTGIATLHELIIIPIPRRLKSFRKA